MLHAHTDTHRHVEETEQTLNCVTEAAEPDQNPAKHE